MKGRTMILISLVVGAGPIAAFLADTEILESHWGIGAVTFLWLIAWVLYFLGFHRVVIERGYFGELGCLGIIGPLSLIVLLSLPKRGQGTTAGRDQIK